MKELFYLCTSFALVLIVVYKPLKTYVKIHIDKYIADTTKIINTAKDNYNNAKNYLKCIEKDAYLQKKKNEIRIINNRLFCESIKIDEQEIVDLQIRKRLEDAKAQRKTEEEELAAKIMFTFIKATLRYIIINFDHDDNNQFINIHIKKICKGMNKKT